ncbi:MAG TPA: hypothetical protein DEQ61_07435 [Streptomyces sp.]|nr:hypothetical protein [Streptomyces sp.]
MRITAARLLTYTTTTVTTGVTPATGWTVTLQKLTTTGGKKTGIIRLNRSGADLGAAEGFPTTSGNISPDLVVATVTTDWRPPEDLYISCSTGINHGTLRVQADGSCQLLTWQVDTTISNNHNLRWTWTF